MQSRYEGAGQQKLWPVPERKRAEPGIERFLIETERQLEAVLSPAAMDEYRRQKKAAMLMARQAQRDALSRLTQLYKNGC